MKKRCSYICLHRFEPGGCPGRTTPETSDYIPIKQRVEHVETQGATALLAAAKDGSVPGSRAAAGLEE